MFLFLPLLPPVEVPFTWSSAFLKKLFKNLSFFVMEEQRTLADFYQKAIQHFYCEIQVNGT